MSQPAPSAASASAPSAEVWHTVCNLSEIAVGGAKCVTVDGRPLVLFRTKPSGAAPEAAGDAPPVCQLADGSRIWALDRVCYHMGGPLEQGDIEDMGSQYGPVVTCPW
jgi:nitrite reductase/ring-hydroxylating ferredoxin subunit